MLKTAKKKLNIEFFKQIYNLFVFAFNSFEECGDQKKKKKKKKENVSRLMMNSCYPNFFLIF